MNRETGTEQGNGNRTVHAVATVLNGNVTGSRVTFSNDPTNPEGFGRFFRELGSMIESANEPVRFHDPEGFADFDPVPANLERNRQRERENLRRNREFLGMRSRNVTVSGQGKPEPEPEPDGSENPTFSVSIGLSNVPISTIGEWVSESLGSGFGFQLFEHLGYWEGIPERSATIVFQGTRERFESILRVLSIRLPFERFAHVAESNPNIRYFNMEQARERFGSEIVLAGMKPGGLES